MQDRDTPTTTTPANEDHDNALPTPIFICCCPRSGSTVLARVMNDLPTCVALPEGQFIVESAARLRQRELGQSDLDELRSFIRAHWHFRAWGLPLTLADGPFVPSTFHRFMGNFVYEYARIQGASGEPIRYFVDQYPGNVSHCSHLLRHFPDAKFVHLIRDGRAVAASVKPLDWGPNTALHAARWWKRHLADGEAMKRLVRPENLIEIRYERLIQDEAGVIADLKRFLDLLDAKTSAGAAYHLPSFTATQHALVSKPLDPSRIDGWKRRLSRHEIRTFEGVSGQELSRLGYALVHPDRPHRAGLIERGLIKLYEEIRTWANRRRLERRRASS
jgi:hypothetical protein